MSNSASWGKCQSLNIYIRYLEVRFSPVLHINEGLSFSAVMDAICEGLEMAEYHLPITVRVSII